MEIEIGKSIGNGSFKDAFAVVNAANTRNPANIKVPLGTDVNAICYVEYKDPFDISKYIEMNSNVDFPLFKFQMQNGPDFKFYVRYFLDLQNDYNNLTVRKNNQLYQIKDADRLINDQYKHLITSQPEKDFLLVQRIKYNVFTNKRQLRSIYIKNKDLFECIDELTKMYELGIVGLSPRLIKIRIILGTLNKVSFIPIHYGEPFDPTEDINVKINELIMQHASAATTHFKITYLMDRCDEDIYKYYKKIGDPADKEQFLADIGYSINEYVENFVNNQNALNTDSKISNLCPNFSTIKPTVIGLDNDPKYIIPNIYKDANFNKHAKTFMKFSIFALFYKNTKQNINFPNWFVTQQEVDDMITFFYRFEYLKYTFNPVNMLYFYIVYSEKFLEYTNLESYYDPTSADGMDRIKRKFIVPPGAERGNSSSSSKVFSFNNSIATSIQQSSKTGGGSGILTQPSAALTTAASMPPQQSGVALMPPQPPTPPSKSTSISTFLPPPFPLINATSTPPSKSSSILTFPSIQQSGKSGGGRASPKTFSVFPFPPISAQQSSRVLTPPKFTQNPSAKKGNNSSNNSSIYSPILSKKTPKKGGKKTRRKRRRTRKTK